MAELIKVNAPVRKPLFEGVQGENEARSIQFDITPWVDELGTGAVTATAKRSQDSQPYPVTITVDGTTATWNPTSTDTAFAGVGSFQLEYTVNSVLAKTCIWSTMVAPSLDPAGDPPDPYDNWLADMRQVAADALQSAQDADDSADAAAASAAEAEARTEDIKPTQLNLEKVYYPSIDIDGITTGTGYYTWSGVGSTPIYRTLTQHLIVPVAGGDVIQCYVGDLTILTSQATGFFVTVDSDGKCTAFTSDWQLINQDEYIYQFTVPANAATLYLTYANGITPWVKKCVGTFEIDWLKLKEENFDDNVIPESAIKGSAKYKYGDSFLKPFVFSDKNCAVFGDSIAYGVCSPDLALTTPFIQRFLSSVSASNISNRAISGTCIADPDGQYSILNRVLEFTNTNYTVFFVAGGTNDFNTSKEIGAFGSTDTTTFYGALKAICEKFQTDFPNATVIFITPIPYTEAYFDLHPTLKDGNALGYTLNDYRNAIYEVATYYGFNVVDGSNLGMPTGKGGWSNAMCDDSDGCHPTVAGHELYARNLQGKLC